MAAGLEIIREPASTMNGTGSVNKNKKVTDPASSWIMARVVPWRNHRDTQFKEKWEEYYRLWRGVWDPSDSSRGSERSRLINPAIMQAVEVSVSEIEEAIFGGGRRWLDLQDDLRDEERTDMELILKLLLEDFELDNIKDAISEVVLNSTLYGTGIAKIAIERNDILVPREQVIEGTTEVRHFTDAKKRLAIKLIPIDPFSFVVDPSATTIAEALGVAHESFVAKHTIERMQDRGVYKKVAVDRWDGDLNLRAEEFRDSAATDQILITEWHGLVPKKLLMDDSEKGEFFEFSFENEGLDNKEFGMDNLVEAIVTIANESTVLKAVENPFLMKDRCIISYQHDMVPNRFWGRGIVEKGYNPQKALDTEMRARIDSLALSTYPMLAIDGTSLPKGMAGDRFAVHPGRTLITVGDPHTKIREFKFSPPDSHTFRQTADLERQVQMGTGAMDSATPIGVSPRNQTASGMSMILAGALKRSKRTLQNLERNFLDPLVKKSLWRFMQFDPERYPTIDFKFIVHSTMGIMAREFEQSQMTQLLQTVPPQTPAYWLLLRGIFDNSSFSDKERIVEVTDSIIESMTQPQQNQEPPPELQFKMAELEHKKQTDVAKLELDARKIQNDVNRNDFISQIEMRKLDLDEVKRVAEFKKLKDNELEKISIAVLNIAKAESEKAQSTIKTTQADIKTTLEALENANTTNDSFQQKMEEMIQSLGEDLNLRDKLSTEQPRVLVEQDRGSGKDAATPFSPMAQQPPPVPPTTEAIPATLPVEGTTPDEIATPATPGEEVLDTEIQTTGEEQ